MAVHILRSARAALEVTRGTDLTPTRLLYFDQADHQQDIKTIRPQQLRNSYFGWYSATVGTELNTVKQSGILSYDDMIWYANCHIKAVAAGVGAGADKLWTFVPSAATDDLKSATIQLGYTDGLGATAPAVKVNGLLGDVLVLKWDKAGDGIVTFDSTMIGTSAAAQITAFTGALTDRVVTLASAINTQVYIDTTTIGTTTDFAVMDATWTLNNGYKPLFTLNNATNPTALLRPSARAWKLDVTRYYGIYGGAASADAEWDAYIAKTVRKVRIKTVGATLGATNYIIQLDLYGVYTAMSNAETNDFGVQKFTLEPIYDVATTTDFQLLVTNATASIT